jgi:hypothetical protein
MAASGRSVVPADHDSEEDSSAEEDSAADD